MNDFKHSSRAGRLCLITGSHPVTWMPLKWWLFIRQQADPKMISSQVWRNKSQVLYLFPFWHILLFCCSCFAAVCCDLFSPPDDRTAMQARTFTRWINLVLQRVTHNSRLPHYSSADASELISHFAAPRAILQLLCMTCSKTFGMEGS